MGNLPEKKVQGSNHACMCAKLLQWRLTLCYPMDRRPPGSSVHRIFQARMLEWVAMPLPRIIIQMIKELGRRMDAQNKKLEVFKRVRKYKEQPNRGEEYNNRNEK